MSIQNSINPLSIVEGEIEQHSGGKDGSKEAKASSRGGDIYFIDGYDEECYLSAFPDIAKAVVAGEWASGWEHYEKFGAHENRLQNLRYQNAVKAEDTAGFSSCAIDALFVTRGGWCFVVGWLNDENHALREIVFLKGKKVVAATNRVARCRREDAEKAVSAQNGKLLGFWAVIQVEPDFAAADDIRICLRAGREQKTFPVQPRWASDEQLRDVALEYFAGAGYFTNPQIESASQLDGAIGNALIRLNVEISSKIVCGAHVARFGPSKRDFAGSIVVCLFGRAEYLFLQAAAFSMGPGAANYEFIYVSNSPELGETLLKEAAIATRIYGLNITLVILPSNAGFGAANNIAAEHATSDRILFVNPDVFPRDRGWAAQHTAIVEGLPANRTTIFGATLYYDDGSLMHAGMYFDIDSGLSIRNGHVEHHELIRVEHLAKGAPPRTEHFLRSRAVPAVTGAFISIDRAWFEALGGFSLEYVFGHYEDADLCLKSLMQGVPVWVHNLPFWHMEGKGSSRHQIHEGGSIVNRWHFTRLWKELIATDVCGRSPARLASP